MGTNASSLWMAVMSMFNEAEAFVVTRELGRRNWQTRGPIGHKTFIDLEELYHTRLLSGVGQRLS